MICRMERFFFFQAKAGIRVVAVTGVQTCALPIYVIRAQQRGEQVTLGVAEAGPRGEHLRRAAGDFAAAEFDRVLDLVADPTEASAGGIKRVATGAPPPPPPRPARGRG